MPLLSKPLLRRYQQVAHKSVYDAERELRQAASRSFKSAERYDVFLSHRFLDAREVLALKLILESFGFTVFVDWVESPQLDRAQVSKETAAYLRDAMNRSSSLLYAASENSSESKWMPWELGYSDGRHGRIAVVPVKDQETSSESFTGQEYLGLYPYVSVTKDNTGKEVIWINEGSLTYVSLRDWLNGMKAYRRP
jgi:hypothetical protein